MRNLIIFGGSGIGMIAASIAELKNNYIIKGFLNDDLKKGSYIGKYKKYKVLGKTHDYQSYLDDQNNYFFIAYVGMNQKKNIYNKIRNLKIKKNKFATLIHPSAVIPKEYTRIGNGVLIAPLVQISPDVQIADNSILLGNSFIGHDSKLLRFCHIATNAVIGSNVLVCKGAHIGSNSTIREHVKIGEFSIIGSGSVVLNNVPKKSVYVGNPASELKKL